MMMTFCRYKLDHAGPHQWVRGDSQLKPKAFDQCGEDYWYSPEAFEERARRFNGEVGE